MMRMSRTTTRDVSELLGVNVKTLQFWAREGHISVDSTGSGPNRRIAWTEDAIEQARRVRDRCAGDASLAVAIGPELAQAMERGRKLRKLQFDGDVIVASKDGARVFRSDTTLHEALRRVKGTVFVVLGR